MKASVVVFTFASLIERALSVVKMASSELAGAETTFVKSTLNPATVLVSPFSWWLLAQARVAVLD